jgi:hypothetical protein
MYDVAPGGEMWKPASQVKVLALPAGKLDPEAGVDQEPDMAYGRSSYVQGICWDPAVMHW